MHPEFVPVAFVSAVLVLIVLPWHWRAGNVATLAMSFWLFIGNIIYVVDAAIWGDSVEIVIPVWCDITSKLLVGMNFALPSACLCICIHLEQVSSLRFAKTNLSDKRRRQIFESLMCFGLPMFFMCLHFVVQGHRFDIIEEYGCRPTTYLSVPALFIVWIPPLVVSIISLVFAGLALRHFMLCRISFAAHLRASHSVVTTTRYFRLMLMAALQMIWSLTITAYTLWFTLMAVPMRPWTTWADVHSDFSRIDIYPTAFTPLAILNGFYIAWWILPISTAVFVIFFAFGRDAVDEYKRCFLWFRTRILRWTPASESSDKSGYANMSRTRPIVTSPKPAPSSITNPLVSTTSSLPSYHMPSPPSPTKCKSELDNLEYDSRSESSSYISHGSAPKTITTTPSYVLSNPPCHAPSEVPQSPTTPLESLSRDLTGIQIPRLPRPLTYPSHDATHRGVNPAF